VTVATVRELLLNFIQADSQQIDKVSRPCTPDPGSGADSPAEGRGGVTEGDAREGSCWYLSRSGAGMHRCFGVTLFAMMTFRTEN